MPDRRGAPPTDWIERLHKLGEETGDEIFADAADALQALHDRESCLQDDRHVHDLIFDLAKLCAGDLKSTRRIARLLEKMADEYECGDWVEHQHRMTTPPGLSEADGLLWLIFDQTGAFPSFESLRKILAGTYF